MQGFVTLAEYQRLQDKCDRLKEELAELRSHQSDLDQRALFLRSALGLTPHCAYVLAKLYREQGRIVAIPRLRAIVPCRDVEPEDRHPKHIAVLVCYLRKALGKDIIETSYGYGYRLSERGRVLVDEALLQNVD